MTAPSSPRRLWCLLVAFAACWFLSFVWFPQLYLFVGVNHFGVWFLDTYALLATNDAISLGRDPWIMNPLDPFGRGHVYSHWWLHFRDLGLTRAHNLWLGLAFVAAFFPAALARLRPRTPGEVVWYLVVLCASPLLLAVNRANNDLVVFALLAPVVPCLLSSRAVVRLAAPVLIAIAAGLKFYPAIAGLVLLAGTDARELRRRLVVGVFLLAAVGVNIAPDLVHFAGVAPKAEGLMTFGSVNLLEAGGVHGPRAVALGFVLGALAGLAFARSRVFDGWEIAPADRAAWLSFVLGAVLLTGCFFTSTNFSYRWVFALWLAPLLWRLPRDAAAPAAVRRLAGLTVALLVVALWADALATTVLATATGHASRDAIMRWADRVFLVEQPLTWAFFACLLGFLTHFTRGGLRVLLGRVNPDAPAPSAG